MKINDGFSIQTHCVIRGRSGEAARILCVSIGLCRGSCQPRIGRNKSSFIYSSQPRWRGIELVECAESIAPLRVGLGEIARRQGYFSWALEVSDIEKVFEVAIASGATAVSAPKNASRPGVRFAYVQDPEGNFIELLQFRGVEF